MLEMLLLNILLCCIISRVLSTPTSSDESTTQSHMNLPFTMKSAQQIYDEKLKEKKDALFNKLVEALAGNDDRKIEFLYKPYPDKVPEVQNCYLESYGTFLAQCASINNYDNLQRFKHLVHRICESNWMATEEIYSRIRKTCDENKHLTL